MCLIIRGDENAMEFENIYDEYFNNIYSHIYSLYRDKHIV